MLGLEEKAEVFKSLLSVISWKKILQVAALVFVLALASVMWDNRNQIYTSIKIDRFAEREYVDITPSKQTQDLIKTVISKSSNIVGVEVVNVNFRKNTYSIAYFEMSDPSLRAAYATDLAQRVADESLFTHNESGNQRIVNLINGDFSCTPYADLPYHYKASLSSISTVCSVSIPPFYGKFSGYLNLYLKSAPSTDEANDLRTLAKNLSSFIYEKDLH